MGIRVSFLEPLADFGEVSAKKSSLCTYFTIFFRIFSS